jgi:hypothetical protein
MAIAAPKPSSNNVAGSGASMDYTEPYHKITLPKDGGNYIAEPKEMTTNFNEISCFKVSFPKNLSSDEFFL